MIFDNWFCEGRNPTPSIPNIYSQTNTVLLHKCQGDYISSHPEPLCVKYIGKGSKNYGLGGQQLTVNQHTYLILNKGQDYETSIQTLEEVFSFCLYFSERLVLDVFANCIRSQIYLLDNGNGFVTDKEVMFYQKLYWKDEKMEKIVSAFLQKIKTRTCLSEFEEDEWCIQVLELLFRHHIAETRRIQSINATKASTKKELYKRIGASVDYIHENYSNKITLSQLSKVSCLSEYHLHRLFRSSLRATPYQYLTQTRLKMAALLLKESCASLSDICFSCGFEDVSSFIRLFKKYNNITPNAFRKLK